MRTFLAFLLAPSAAPLIYATITATRRPPGEGPTWIDSFAQNFFVASLLSYLISLTFGTVVFFVLTKTRRESLGLYALLGAVGGFFCFAVAAVQSEFTTAVFTVSPVFAFLGLMVSTCFALIRGVPRKPNLG